MRSLLPSQKGLRYRLQDLQSGRGTRCSYCILRDFEPPSLASMRTLLSQSVFHLYPLQSESLNRAYYNRRQKRRNDASRPPRLGRLQWN